MMWKQDIEVWDAGTELHESQRGPAIIQRLGGTARVLARNIPRDMSTRTSVDMNGQPQVSGVQAIMHQLEK
eukprot:2454064-Karenia_brevis.AAC.1